MPWLRTSGHLKSKSLVLLSGEAGTIPAAEAKALFSSLDPRSRFQYPSPRLVIAESGADPFSVGGRIAFARRVGVLVGDADGAAPLLEGRRIRFRSFDLGARGPPPDPDAYLGRVGATIDLRSPELELTLVRAEEEYLAVTSPGSMHQGWSERRPRKRPFFHPTAIFPKLSRALVNLTGCKRQDIFLDPFAGTGSIPLEAYLVGARVVAADRSDAMSRGAAANMRHFGQTWLGVLLADCARLPLARADAVATDIPYGRASSTRGRDPSEILGSLLASIADIMPDGSGLVVMHPKELAVEGGGDFVLKEEHDLHVHKLLTRTISVLGRR